MPTVAIDLDGCLAEYEGWAGIENIGDPLPGAIEAVAKIMAAGYDVVIHTARCMDRDGASWEELEYADGTSVKDAERIVSHWLTVWGFPEGITVWTGRGKPAASWYLDDRAMCVAPQRAAGAWDAAVEIICARRRQGVGEKP